MIRTPANTGASQLLGVPIKSVSKGATRWSHKAPVLPLNYPPESPDNLLIANLIASSASLRRRLFRSP